MCDNSVDKIRVKYKVTILVISEITRIYIYRLRKIRRGDEPTKLEKNMLHLCLLSHIFKGMTLAYHIPLKDKDYMKLYNTVIK